MRRITTLLTFSFIFLFAGEYANAQYAAPGTRPHMGVPEASIPATIPGAGSGSIPTYTSQRPATIPRAGTGSIPAYTPYGPATVPGSARYAPQAPATAPRYTPSGSAYQPYRPVYSGQTSAPVYRPNRVYVPSAPQYVPTPVYVPSAPQYVPTPVYVPSAPVYTQAPEYYSVPEPVYIPGHDRDAFIREHRRWEEERARHMDHDRDHAGAAYRAGEHAGAAQAQAHAEDARMAHGDNGRHLGWDNNGRR